MHACGFSIATNTEIRKIFGKLLKQCFQRQEREMTCMEFIKVDAFAFLVNEISEMERQLNISRIPTNLKNSKLLSILVIFFNRVCICLSEMLFD